MAGLAPRERSQKIIAELGKMWKALSEQDRADWKERAPVVKRKIKAKKPSKKRAKKTDDDAPAQRSSPVPYIGPETLVGPYPIDEEALRKLKRLHDDGIIDERQKTKMKGEVQTLFHASCCSLPNTMNAIGRFGEMGGQCLRCGAGGRQPWTPAIDDRTRLQGV